MAEYAYQTDPRTRAALTQGAARQRPEFGPRAPLRGPHDFAGGVGVRFSFSSRCRHGCGAYTQGAERIVVPPGVPRVGPCPNAPLQKPTEAPKAGKVFVRGRFTTAGRRFDVLKILGDKVELYARDCIWPEEAMELAIACLRGRFSVPVRGSRTNLARSSSGLLVPVSGIGAADPDASFVRRSSTLVEVTLNDQG